MGSKSFAPYVYDPIVFSHLTTSASRSWHDRRTTTRRRWLHVNSNKLWMTAPSTATACPSGFGIPMSSQAFGTTTVVRERVAFIGATDAAKAGLGLTQSYIPGTSAWRPPTC